MLSPGSLGRLRRLGRLGRSKDPIGKDFESFVFWVFLHNLNDPNNLVGARLKAY